MDLLIHIENNNHLTNGMLAEIFELRTQKDFRDILLDLSNDFGYQLITYFMGILKGIRLCNIALEDPKASIELQDKICSIMVSDRFIPTNLESVLGRDFTIDDNDVKVYKKFIKKLNRNNEKHKRK